MAHAAPPPVPINDVRLPLDLNAIGINFELTADTVAEIDYILPAVSEVPYFENNLRVSNNYGDLVFRAHRATNPSSIIIDGVEYRVVAHAGNGQYGATCIVACDIGGGLEKRFVLKEQASDPKKKEDIAFVKEAIINHVIYKATSSQPPIGAAAAGGPVYKPFAGQVYKVFYSTRGDEKIYCLIDLLAIDARKYLQVSVTNDGDIFSRSAAIYNIFNQYIYRLKQLYEAYQYSHGDFKPDNVMFDHDDTLRLIDFGFSKITLKDASDTSITITTNPEYNRLDNTSQDNTNMAVAISMTTDLTLNGYGLVYLSSYDFIEKIVNGYGCDLTRSRGYGVSCRIINPDGTTTNHVLRNIGHMYKFCDRYTNPTGTFDAVIADLEARELPADTINPSKRGFSLPQREAPAPVQAVVIGGANLKRRNKTKRNSKKNVKSAKKRATRRYQRK